MKRYRRIEITAFRRRVTVTSAGMVLNNSDNQSAPAEEGVQLNDGESGEAIEFESAEGQLILVDAVHSLERRLTPEVRAALYRPSKGHLAQRPGRIRVYSKLRALMHSVIHPKPTCLHRKEK